MQDLSLSRIGRRITGWATVISLVGFAMLGTVYADDNEWGRSAIAYGVFFFFLYFWGTSTYRLRMDSTGRVEANQMLAARHLIVRDGFRVKRSLLFGPLISVVRVGRKRIRVSGLLGKPAEVEAWLRNAADLQSVGSTVSGNG